MYSRILICLGNPRHAGEMTKLALSVAEKNPKLIFLRIAPFANNMSLIQMDRDLQFLDKVKVKGKPIKFEKRVSEGKNVGKAILRIANKEGVDLIVMGAIPHKGIFDRLIQDIPNYVMNNSDSAVVLVKGRK